MKRRVFRISAALAVTLVVLALLPASAFGSSNTVWVDATWTEGNCGGHTWGYDAFNTIQAGVNAVAVGGTVNVAAGIYSEHVTLSTAGVHLLGEAGAIIDGGGTGACLSVGANDVTVDGFELRNGYNGIEGETSGSTFSNNLIHNNVNTSGYAGVGILLWGDNDNNHIVRNHIYSNDRQGIFVGFNPSVDPAKLSTGNIIDSNVIYNNGQYTAEGPPDRSNYGIQLWYAQGNEVTGNEIYGHSQPSLPGFFDVGIGVYLCQAAGNTVTGNNIHGNRMGVVMYDCGTVGGCANNDVSGNIITGTDLGAFRLYNDAETTTFEGNDLSGNAYAVKNYDSERLVATDNWWGSASGPAHPSNTYNVGDQGDTLAPSGYDNVAFVPWLDAPPPGGVSFAPVRTTDPAGGFASITAAIAASNADGSINLAPGTYTEDGQIVISKNLSIVGNATNRPVIRPAGDTGSSGDAKGWFLVNDGVVFNLRDTVLDGEGRKVYQAIRSLGSGTIQNNVIRNIGFNPSGPDYAGSGIVMFGDAHSMTVTGNTFSNIGRVGVLAFGSGVTSAVINGNTYTGKGAGNWLDYAFEVGGGARASISGNTISNNLGVATVDGSTSAGILVTTYYGAGTQAEITHNTVTGCSTGIAVGYDASDTSTVTAVHNVIAGNVEGLTSTAPTVFATENWWGHATGPFHPTLNAGGLGDEVSDNVTFDPWDTGTLYLTATARVPLGDRGDVSAWLTMADGTLITAPVDVEFSASRGFTGRPVVTTSDGYADTWWSPGMLPMEAVITARAAGLEASVTVSGYSPPPAPTGGFTGESEDGVVTVDVPDFVYGQPVSLTIAPADDPPPVGGNPCLGIYDVELYVTATGDPVRDLYQSLTIVIHYTDAMLAAAGVTDPADLRIWYWDVEFEAWIALPTVVDTVARTVSATVDHLTTFALMVDPDFPALPDTAGHWAEESILRLASLGAISGYEDGRFRPETSVTRAQFAKMLVLALGIPEGSALPAGFSDASSVPTWALPYVAACVRDEIMTGSNGLIRPNDTITRAEAAAMVVRGLGLDPDGSGTYDLIFADVDTIPSWAMPFVCEAVNHAIMSGLPGNVFSPMSTLTRAQAATVLDRALDVE